MRRYLRVLRGLRLLRRLAVLGEAHGRGGDDEARVRQAALVADVVVVFLAGRRGVGPPRHSGASDARTLARGGRAGLRGQHVDRAQRRQQHGGLAKKKEHQEKLARQCPYRAGPWEGSR